ncbi:aminotransferase class I/II-fold pyridoxal phosphate-dependent enzyme [Yoonia sp. 208BN28-4]|uniref:aminotransferase class I/II-fold pyridoxal phosphate-dependent enzyme n=1 Tax=Yoonia sp. 208BN28-4 TaxID=3126505 RepID=UPI00309A214E
MTYPKRFSALPAPTWPRLRALLDHRPAGGDVIDMTIGTPKHDMPEFVGPIIADNIGGFRGYPDNNGMPALLDAIALWLDRRFDAKVGPENLMVLNGTREGLYNAAIALNPEEKNGEAPVILLPNPFYTSYPSAAASVGAQSVFVPATPENGYLPDFASLPDDILRRTTIAYVGSPTNPHGAMADAAYWGDLIALADKYDFKIFADECYSEIYRDTPPTGALEMAQRLGADPERVLVFHSLSKRSNLAGLRSGFVASGPENIARIRRMRAYSGSPVPGPLQIVSAAAWLDETHVEQSRALYQQKYSIADKIMGQVPGYMSPQAGFFLWLPVDDGEAAAVKLWEATGVKTLPGAYLCKDVDGANPGQGFIRVALVAPTQEVQRGLTQIRDCLYG